MTDSTHRVQGCGKRRNLSSCAGTTALYCHAKQYNQFAAGNTQPRALTAASPASLHLLPASCRSSVVGANPRPCLSTNCHFLFKTCTGPRRVPHICHQQPHQLATACKPSTLRLVCSTRSRHQDTSRSWCSCWLTGANWQGLVWVWLLTVYGTTVCQHVPTCFNVCSTCTGCCRVWQARHVSSVIRQAGSQSASESAMILHSSYCPIAVEAYWSLALLPFFSRALHGMLSCSA